MRKLDLVSVGGGILVLTIICSTTLSAPMITVAYNWPSDFRPYGGYVDEILFVGTGNGALDLLINKIDAWGEDVFSEYIPSLIRDPNIEVDINQSLGYRMIALNCNRFPTNITGYRRAMAFGMDKHLISAAVGTGGDPLDSYIPTIATEWEVENQMDMHFYQADFVSGNASLEAAGFKDLDTDGWREYDINHNGIWDESTDLDDLDCEIEIIVPSGWDPAVITSDITANGLHAMGMRATIIEEDYFWDSLGSADFNAWCLSFIVDPITPSYLMYDVFRSGQSWADEIFHFSNSSVDEALDMMMNATSATDVKDTSVNVMKLLLYELPMIVCYNDVDVSAYRTDKFEGYQPFSGYGMVNWKNPYICTKVRLRNSQGGGIFRYGTPGWLGPDNILLPIHAYDHHYLQYIYETLWQIDPITKETIPGLAEDWDIEPTTKDISNNVQTGEKYTFYLNEDATWHDGRPVTSEDVKYSFNTLWAKDLESRYSTRQIQIEDIYRIDTPDDRTVVIYVNKTGYFEWVFSTSHYILPKHIWEPQNLTEWWPRNSTELTGSGPYRWNSSLWNEYLSLVRHDDWHWNIRNKQSATSIPSSTLETSPSTSKTSTTSIDSISGFEVLSVISVVGPIILHIRRKKKRLSS